MWKRLHNIINYFRVKASIKITEERTKFSEPTLNCEKIIGHPNIHKFLWLREAVDAVNTAYANYTSQITSYNRYNLFFDGIWSNIDKFHHAQSNVQVALDKLNASLNHLSQQLVGGLELLVPDADWSGVAARSGEDHKVIQDFTNKANQQLEMLLNCISDQSPAKCYFVGKLHLRAYQDQLHTFNTSSEELLQNARDKIHDALNRGYYTWEEAEGLYCHALYAIELEKRIDSGNQHIDGRRDLMLTAGAADAKKQRIEALRAESRELLERLHEAGYVPASYKLKEIYADHNEISQGNYEQDTFALNLKLAEANYLPAMKVVADMFIRAVTNARMGRKVVDGDSQELDDNESLLKNILSTEATRKACINVIARGIYYQCDSIMIRAKDLENIYNNVSNKIDGVLRSAQGAEIKGIKTEFTEATRKELSTHTQWLAVARQMLNGIAMASKAQYSTVALESTIQQAMQPKPQKVGGFYVQVNSWFEKLRAMFGSRRTSSDTQSVTPLQQQPLKLYSVPSIKHSRPELATPQRIHSRG